MTYGFHLYRDRRRFWIKLISSTSVTHYIYGDGEYCGGLCSQNTDFKKITDIITVETTFVQTVCAVVG